MLMHAFWWWRRPVCTSILVNLHIHHTLHHGLEDELVIVCAISLRLLILVRLQRGEEAVDAFGKAIVDDALVLEGAYLVTAMVTFLVDLCLFRANEGLFVNVGMYFDIAVVGELQVILIQCQKLQPQNYRSASLTHLL
jgi:hypothetical protein